MVDLKRWYECVTDKPKNKGKYLLMVALPNKKAGHSYIGVIDATWNGQTWLIRDKYKPMRWKYSVKDEIYKYPDFDNNNIKRRVEDD